MTYAEPGYAGKLSSTGAVVEADMRKWTTYFCGALMAAVLIIPNLAAPARAAEPDWVLLDDNLDSHFYYDQGGAKKPVDGVVQVRTRVVYTPEGKADALKILGGPKIFEPLYESRYVHDLDCVKEQTKLLEASHLDKDGIILKSSNLAAVTQWEEIPPFARMGLVLEKACPPPPDKKK